MSGHVVPSEGARELFGEVLPVAQRYADLLADAGVQRGLIGPREVPRLWERHLMNCAVVEELIPKNSHVIDIGSGAGLPGLVLAILRPDLSVTLLEPLLRRTVFLQECVDLLALENVTVRRGRAEEVKKELRADFVTARAVAPLPRLAGWALPLLGKGGSLLAMKGEQAEVELEAARQDLFKQRPGVADVIRVGGGKVDPATTVVRVTVTTEAQMDRQSGRPTGKHAGKQLGGQSKAAPGSSQATPSRSQRAPDGRKKRGRKR